MINTVDDTPFIAIVDDDGHSAYLLTRALVSHGAQSIRHLGGEEAGEAALATVLADVELDWPGLVIVDLKSHSGANLEFLARNHAVLRQKGIPVAVMTAPLDSARRDALQAAGASAVFFRHAERDAYRQEAASIVSFWARHQRLDAVGM